MTSSSNPLLLFKDAKVNFVEGEVALDVTLAVDAGEFVVVTGDNGSGKSTLLKLAAALYVPTAGNTHLFGLDSADSQNLSVIRSRMSYIFQNPDESILCPVVKNEVAFALENAGVVRDEILSRVDKALQLVGLAGFEERLIDELSGGQRQLVSIAAALATRPDVLIADEPCSMLDANYSARVINIFKDICAHGTTLLVATHNEQLMSLASREIELKGGRIIYDGKPRVTSQDAEGAKARHADVARDSLAAQSMSPNISKAMHKETLLSFNNVSFTYDIAKKSADADANTNGTNWVLQNVNFSVDAGEIIAITGPNGSGKSTLISLMNGAASPVHGEILVCGTPTSGKRGRNAARKHAGVVRQNPENQIFASTVLEDICFGPINYGASKDQARGAASDALNTCGLDAGTFANKNPFMISGGEQRKVAIAGILAFGPRIIVMDEPTCGLDTTSIKQLAQTIKDLAARGHAIIFATHNMQFIKQCNAKHYKLNNGQLSV
jgi:energy-coupling factor transport system ATP-binding protein